MRSSAAIGLIVCALASLAVAAESIAVSGNHAAPAGASQIVSNGIESQLPSRRILARAQDCDHEVSLFHKLRPKSLRVSHVGAASDNVKALAQVSMTMLADLAATNNVVGYLLGNESTAALSNYVYEASGAESLGPGFSMSPGRRRIASVGAALFAITLFFAIYM